MGFINLSEDGSGYLKERQKDIIRDLLKEIVIRGTDASGVAIWHGDEQEKSEENNSSTTSNSTDVSMLKANITSWELAQHKVLDNMLKRPVKMLIGHSRAGTSGREQLNINNHPFVTRSREVFLVHNGVISREGEREVKDLLLGECDTEVLIRSIEKHGIKEGFTKAAGWRQASYAVLMMYPSIGKMFFLRRSNPMYWWWSRRKDIEGIYIASTEHILKSAIPEATPREVNDDMLYSIKENQTWLTMEKNYKAVTKRYGGNYVYYTSPYKQKTKIYQGV
jgi:glucosamine 6-phosphate synthetase-like amidotransferase/phosphosugar isomerase protein